VDLYWIAVKSFGTWLTSTTKCPGVELKGLPKERAAQPPLDDTATLRLGVALGLSYPRYEIGEMLPSRQIEDITPHRVEEKEWWERSEFLSKEMC